MENRRAIALKDKFPKKFEDNEEGYTFLSIAGKLPRNKALSDGNSEAEDCGDSSTVATEVGKAKDCGDSSTKEASGVGKDVRRSSTIGGKAGDSIYSNSDGSCCLTEEEQRMIKEFHSHLNAVGPYDIEMKPPSCSDSSLNPQTEEDLELIKEFKPRVYEKYFLGPAKFALQQINVKENRNYKFDGIVKLVGTPLQHVYLTIAGKEEICTKSDMKLEWTCDRATFQAKVYTPYGIGYGSDDYELLEWKRKPDLAAAS